MEKTMSRKKNKQKLISKMNKYFAKIWGILLIGIGLVFFLSLMTYHKEDPSFNNQKEGVALNLFGGFGASLSDFVFTNFGMVLPLFALGFFVWGYHLIRHNTLLIWKMRLFAFFIGVLSGTIVADLVFQCKMPDFFSNHEWGGTIGRLILENMALGKYPPYVAQSVIAGLGLISFLALNLVLGITYADWFKGMHYIIKAFKIFMLFLFKNLKKIVWLIQKIKIKTASAEHEEQALFPPEQKSEPKIVIDEPKQKPASQKEQKRLENPVVSSKPEIFQNGYSFPDTNLLSRPKETGNNTFNQKELDEIARKLESVLQEFGVNGKIVRVRPGPVVTLYELEPAPGTKTARVIGLSDDIARSMSAVSVRIAVVSGSNTIGIEMPNLKRETVWLKDLLEDPCFRETKNTLNVVLGKDISGKNTYADLAKMPHLLVAGTTGSGKSVGVNSMILSLLFRMTPEECKLIMIDPKMLEFSMYNGIPHLLTPVITDPAKAVVGLKWAVREMEERYRKMAELNVRNIAGYNQKLKELRESGEKVTRTIQVGFDAETGKPLYEEQSLDTTPLPYIVIVVDEMADLMLVAGKEVEAAIQRLAQMARAAGLHLIMSTQRPSVDVITGTIKANFPSRISFQVTSKIDSRTILGEQGAEQLLGMGDMLYMPAGLRPLRVHGSFVKDSEVESVVAFLKTQGAPKYVNDVTEGELSGSKDAGAVFDNTGMGSEEDLYQQAVSIVRNDKKASTSYIQRKLRIGYNRAAALIDRMEEEGIVSPSDHVGRREVIG